MQHDTRQETTTSTHLLQELAGLRQRVALLAAVDVVRQQVDTVLGTAETRLHGLLTPDQRPPWTALMAGEQARRPARQPPSHLTQLAAQVALAEEQERRRIAQGLHDQVGQLLAVARSTLDTVQTAGGPGGLERALGTIRTLLDQALQEVRALTFTLSSPLLYTLGLEAAVTQLGEHLGDQHGFRFQCATDPEPVPLSDPLRVMLYRAARELLVNVVKHAQARHVWMAVHRVGPHLHLTVHDDGVGFDSAAPGPGFTPTGGFGLCSIRQHVDAVGGTLEIDAEPGQGSRVRLVVSLTGHTCI